MDFPCLQQNIYSKYIGNAEEKGLLHAGVHFPNEPVSQYICMKLPITDDNDSTHKNDANTLSWHMVNVSFQTNASLDGHGPSWTRPISEFDKNLPSCYNI